MCFVDNEGNILVPKAVRPVMEYEPTTLGEKRDQKNNTDMETCTYENMIVITVFIMTK